MRIVESDEFELAERAAADRLSGAPVSFPAASGLGTKVMETLTRFEAGEPDAASFFRNALHGAITAKEFDLLQRLLGLTADFGQLYTGIPFYRKTGVLRVVAFERVLQYLFPIGAARPRIIELSPGDGMLAALAMLRRSPYAGVEKDSNLYSYQSLFCSFTAVSRKIEALIGTTMRGNRCLESEDEFYDLWQGCVEGMGSTDIGQGLLRLTRPHENRAWFAHLPWWSMLMLEDSVRPNFDILAINHGFLSWPPETAGKILAQAVRFIQAEDSLKCLAALNWDMQDTARRRHLEDLLAPLGYRLAYHKFDIALFTYTCAPGEEQISLDTLMQDGKNLFQEQEEIEFQQIEALYTLLDAVKEEQGEGGNS